jgi:cytochrome b
MALVSEHGESGPSGARDVRVWDPLVRLIHWGVALTILVNGAFLEEDSVQHEWVGYTALGLVVVRLLWGLIGSRHARFSAFPPNPMAAIRHAGAMRRGDKTVHVSHNPLGALMAYNLWGTIVVICVTGYMMGTNRFFGVEWVEEVHEIAFNWLIASFVLHLGGVVFDSWRSGVALVRAMVTGTKKIPKGRPVE